MVDTPQCPSAAVTPGTTAAPMATQRTHRERILSGTCDMSPRVAARRGKGVGAGTGSGHSASLGFGLAKGHMDHAAEQTHWAAPHDLGLPTAHCTQGLKKKNSKTKNKAILDTENLPYKIRTGWQGAHWPGQEGKTDDCWARAGARELRQRLPQ